MHILLIRLNLGIPQAHSLKDKRRQIKSLKERVMSRFNASVAEVEFLDNWQKSVLAVCMLSNDRSYLDKQFSLLEARVLEYTELELLSMDREWL
ncbi:YlxP-like protein [hydrothermal vent metagenome]|uniref:YlxP-like protein n=1 Tax=hydrothermal vent metagenome TaxID=652676 RepID=A0A3B0X2N2_9ZZZZ